MCKISTTCTGKYRYWWDGFRESRCRFVTYIDLGILKGNYEVPQTKFQVIVNIRFQLVGFSTGPSFPRNILKLHVIDPDVGAAVRMFSDIYMYQSYSVNEKWHFEYKWVPIIRTHLVYTWMAGEVFHGVVQTLLWKYERAVRVFSEYSIFRRKACRKFRFVAR